MKHNGENMRIEFSIEYEEDTGYYVGHEYRNDNSNDLCNEGDLLTTTPTLKEAIEYLKTHIEEIIHQTYYF